MAVPPFVIKRPTQLIPRTNPVPSEVMASDNGSSVEGVTWSDGVNAAVPVASQSEAIAGTDNHRRMTPLTTKQAIDAQVDPKINNAIGDLSLGSASRSDISDFATAAQGSTADSAVQPDDLAPVATSNSYNDLDDKPIERLLPAGGFTSQALVKSSDDDYAVEWVSSSAATAVSYAPQILTDEQKSQARENTESQKAGSILEALRTATLGSNTLLYATGADTFDTTPISPFSRSILSDPDGDSVWGTIGGAQELLQNGLVRLPGGVLIQQGTVVVTSDAAGLFYFGFPTANLNGDHITIMFNGDRDTLPTRSPMINRGQIVNTGVYGAVVDMLTGSVSPNVTIRINFISIGRWK